MKSLLLGIAMDERPLSLGAPRVTAQRSSGIEGHRLGIAKLPIDDRLPPVRQRVRVGSGSVARKGLALDGFEPCEGKLSRTVLSGAWAG